MCSPSHFCRFAAPRRCGRDHRDSPPAFGTQRGDGGVLGLRPPGAVHEMGVVQASARTPLYVCPGPIGMGLRAAQLLKAIAAAAQLQLQRPGKAREPSMGWLSLVGLGGALVRNGLEVCFELVEFLIGEVFKGIRRLVDLLRHERRDHADIRGRVFLTHPV